jgi:hypothetical protein
MALENRGSETVLASRSDREQRIHKYIAEGVAVVILAAIVCFSFPDIITEFDRYFTAIAKDLGTQSYTEPVWTPSKFLLEYIADTEARSAPAWNEPKLLPRHDEGQGPWCMRGPEGPFGIACHPHSDVGYDRVAVESVRDYWWDLLVDPREGSLKLPLNLSAYESVEDILRCSRLLAEQGHQCGAVDLEAQIICLREGVRTHGLRIFRSVTDCTRHGFLSARVQYHGCANRSRIIVIPEKAVRFVDSFGNHVYINTLGAYCLDALRRLLSVGPNNHEELCKDHEYDGFCDREPYKSMRH